MYCYIILWVWMCHSVISSVSSFAVRPYTQWESLRSFTEHHKFLVEVHLEFESSCEERKRKKKWIFTPLNVILPILTRTNISFWNNSPLESAYLSYYSDVPSSLHVCKSLPLFLHVSSLSFVSLTSSFTSISLSVPHYLSSLCNKRVSLKPNEDIAIHVGVEIANGVAAERKF